MTSVSSSSILLKEAAEAAELVSGAEREDGAREAAGARDDDAVERAVGFEAAALGAGLAGNSEQVSWKHSETQ